MLSTQNSTWYKVLCKCLKLLFCYLLFKVYTYIHILYTYIVTLLI